MGQEKVKNEFEKPETDIVYSKAIKAGKRIYYLDVKKSRNSDLFVAITESKKKVFGTDENMQVTFEKHKIFLYKEDFDKFLEGIEDVINYVKKEREKNENTSELDDFMTKDEAIVEAENLEEKTNKGFFSKFKL